MEKGAEGSERSGAHVCRHLRLWQTQASQKSHMAPTSAMPVAFPPWGTQQSRPRHLHAQTAIRSPFAHQLALL